MTADVIRLFPDPFSVMVLTPSERAFCAAQEAEALAALRSGASVEMIGRAPAVNAIDAARIGAIPATRAAIAAREADRD